MLRFLRTGSCFNVSDGNNACYYLDKSAQALLLIDCGESVFERIVESGLLDGIRSIDILITHLHSDHAGSLPSLLFYCDLALGLTPKVIYPDRETMGKYLGLTGNDARKFELVRPSEYDRYETTEIGQEHSKFIKAYGYLIRIDGELLYYSGDAHTISPKVLHLLNDGRIDHFYQDTTRYENASHLNIDTLYGLVAAGRRDRVVCMHLDDDIAREKAEGYGFHVAE